jgi:hypothetical protein
MPNASPVLIGVGRGGGAAVINALADGIVIKGLTLEGAGRGVLITHDVTVTDSTMTENDEGVFVESGNPTISNSTITGDDVGVATIGGGTTVASSTIAGNPLDLEPSAGSISFGADILDASSSGCEIGGGTAVDLGYNISSDATCPHSAVGSVAGSSTLDDSLVPLADNGGPTQTIGLKAGSPAIGLVAGLLTDDTQVCGTLDQRGLRRPQPTCDAGAFETSPAGFDPRVELAVSPSGGAQLGQQVTLTATLSRIAGDPAGTVRFTADGNTISGCEAVAPSAGVATCQTATLTAGSYDLRAHYSGDANYLPGSDDIPTYVVAPRTVSNPTITASVSGHKNHAGWYRTPVAVSFTCTAGSAPLSGACPSPVTLTSSRANQTVQRTIVGTDGGAATATVGPINIDRVPPTVKVTGVKKGHHYRTTRHPKASCHDALSGIAHCKLVTHTTSHHGRKTVHYTATATDRAGNTAIRKGKYTVG